MSGALVGFRSECIPIGEKAHLGCKGQGFQHSPRRYPRSRELGGTGTTSVIGRRFARVALTVEGDVPRAGIRAPARAQVAVAVPREREAESR